MPDRRVIASTVGIAVGLFLVLGLSAIFVQGKEYHGDSVTLTPHSQVSQEMTLTGGDTVRIKSQVSEEQAVNFLVVRENMTRYEITALRTDFTITVPGVVHSEVYNFIIENPHDNSIHVEYLYEVTLMHNFMTGLLLLTISAILTVATFFAFLRK